MSSENVTRSGTATVFRREFANYFNTPIGYIFLSVFVFLNLFLVFYFQPKFWESGRNVSGLFQWMRIIFLFFIPAVTMRLWAEERRSGTMEVLFTLPLHAGEIVLGKFLAAACFLAVALATTLVVPLNSILFGEPDYAVLVGAYLGSWMLGSAYIALGMLISYRTSDQIIAFLITFTALFFIFLLSLPPVLQFFGPIKGFVAFFSANWHFESIYRGLLDSRDFVYFISLSGLCLYGNYHAIREER